MSTFYLLRHAHVDWGPGENYSLSPRGRADAIRVADLLQQYPVRAIYSSPYPRAIETVTPLANRLDLPVQREPDLRERRLGDSPTEDFFAAVEATWRDPSFAHPGGESNAAAGQRGVAVLRRLQEAHPKDQIVISTHGNLLALILQNFDPTVDFLFWKSLTMPDLLVLNIDHPGGPSISRLWQES